MSHKTDTTESVEYLAMGFERDTQATAGDRSPTCWMFDCLGAKGKVQERRDSYAHKRASRRIGVERAMRLTYNQPHLVEPMKLTVYDELPSTPMTAQQPLQVSTLVAQSRKSLSRASTKASLVVRRRTTQLRPSISKPRPVVPADGCQLRRNLSFRPLQLSIYLADKRLSDLPEFDAASFTEEGELKVPPRAVTRTQSEELLRSRSPYTRSAVPNKPASMFEKSLSRRMSHIRQNTDSTIMSTSRPSSAYDALHSHPVSWYSLPGIAPVMQFANAPNRSMNVLTPMQEEFTPSPSGAVIINGKVLAFPNVDAHRVNSEMTHSSLLPPASGQERCPSAPSPIVDPGPSRRTTIIAQHKAKLSEAASILLASSSQSTKTYVTTLESSQTTTAEPFEEPKSYFHTDYKTNNRINQWLDDDSKDPKSRSRGSSVSTTKTSTTTSSFAEHRRKRSHFYQLNHSKPAASTIDGKPTCATKLYKGPTPLTLYKPFPPQTVVQSDGDVHTHLKNSLSLRSHARTQTTSTVASTIATDVVFEQPETPELEFDNQFGSDQALPSRANQRPYDAESITTADIKSRTGTIKSSVTDDYNHRPSLAPTNETNVSEIVSVTKGNSFIFHSAIPSPASLSPCTPLSARARDIEKMMFEMCAQSGYRRVNVGVAF